MEKSRSQHRPPPPLVSTDSLARKAGPSAMLLCRRSRSTHPWGNPDRGARRRVPQLGSPDCIAGRSTVSLRGQSFQHLAVAQPRPPASHHRGQRTTRPPGKSSACPLRNLTPRSPRQKFRQGTLERPGTSAATRQWIRTAHPRSRCLVMPTCPPARWGHRRLTRTFRHAFTAEFAP
jgi:hypothetical protein